MYIDNYIYRTRTNVQPIIVQRPHSSHPSQALWNLPRPLSRQVTFGGRGIPCRFPMKNSYLKEESSMKKHETHEKPLKQ
jgi:hypothetical protein